MEPAGADLDGLRTQAGEARGTEPVSSRRRTGPFFRRRRQDRGSVERQIRDPPRHGYAAAAGLGPPVRRSHGAPAEPRAVRRADGADLRGARHPAAARGRQPVGHEPVAVRAIVRERTGDRPVHARRLRRVPGRVRGRLLHRKGDLRRRRVRPGPQGTASREPDPQPRSPGRVPRAGGTAERCEPVRGVPVQLPRGRKPPPPMDPRGLADRRVAAVARSRSRRRPPQEPALRALPMEGLRQSSAQPRAFRVDAPAAGGLDLPARRLVLDRVGSRDPPASFGDGFRPRDVPEAPRRAAAAAPRRRSALRGTALRPGGVYARVPSARGVFQPGRGRAHGRADAVHAQASSRMAPVGDPGSPARRGSGGFFPVDVDRPRDRRRRDDRPRGFEAGRAGDGRARPRPVVRLSRRRLVDQPPARPPQGRPFGEPDPLSPEAFAQDLGVLRDVRRSGRALAAAGQLPGIPHRRDRPPYVADQHGARAPREPGRLRLRVHSVGATPRAHGECAAHDGNLGAAQRPFLQLVRHAIPGTAAPSLRLDGGQREPLGPPADVAAGPARASGSRRPRGAMAGGHPRHLSGSRGCRGRAPASPARAIPGDPGFLARFPSRHARDGETLPRAADGVRRGDRREFPGGRGRRAEPVGAVPRASMPCRIRRRGVHRRLPRPRRDPDFARAGGARGEERLVNRAPAAGTGGEPAREGKDFRDRPPRAAMRGARPRGVRLPLRQGAPSPGDRLQRQPAPTGLRVLRSAGFGSETVLVRGDRAGTTAAGVVVRPGAPAHRHRGGTDSPFVERFDVRVPHAAPGDADVREHADRPYLQGGGEAADRVREEARRAVGHVGIRIQPGRRPPQLSVPGVRGARPRAQAGAGVGSGRGAVCVRSRADGGPRGGVPESAVARGQGVDR